MWGAIEADFHREYAVDLAAPGVLRSITWRWFLVRLGNLSPDSATTHRRKAQKKNNPAGVSSALAAAANRKG